MAIEVILPKWGLTMEVGTLREWRKSEGDRVEAGEVIAEVETEKITNELEAPVGGVIGKSWWKPEPRRWRWGRFCV